MIRWTALCVFLCALTVAIVVTASHLLGQAPLGQPPGWEQKQQPKPNPNPGAVEPVGPAGEPGSGGPTVDRSGPLRIEPISAAEAVTALQYWTIPNGRIQTILRQEVPVEHDGKLVYLATEVKPGEVVPDDKKVVAASWMVAIRDKNVAPENQLIVENPEKGNVYRKWLPADDLLPGRLRVGYVMKTYRKLVEGDTVQEGDLVALVDTELARDELSSKLAKIDVAESEMQTSIKTKLEAEQRYQRMIHANERTPGTFAPEEVSGAELTWQRYIQEELAKRASLVSAQREANAAVTILKKHEVRAQVAGEIKMIYKHADEAIKNLDPVLQIQNPVYLRVEAFLDVQDLSKVKKGMVVTVEPSTPAPPMLILSGHLQAVTGVAVSKAHKTAPGEMPRYTIVSGSEDRMVIGWDSRTGHQLWRMPHRAVIRAVACTGEAAESNLALIGAADGSGQLIDLNDVADKKEPLELEKRHQGAILCVAFSVDGKVCATSGEDRTIYLWDTATGQLLKNGAGIIRSAHRAAVTSLQFTPNNLLVSAGRDGDLNFWSIKPDEPPHKAFDGFDSRGGEVLQLGVSPDGKQVLYDQGKELLVLSLAKRKPEGVLQNYGVSGNFTNMALFAPNGKTILTASAAEKRLQLWRTPTADGRAGELRQFIWSTGLNTCGAFANSQFAVTGTQDHKVLLWKMPSEEELNDRVTGTVSWVDESLSSGSTRQVRIWVDVNNDPKKQRRLIPGSIATLVVPPANP